MTESILLPRILLTNDDGFDAPGLAVLAEVAQDFAREVWIVAPTSDQSGAGSSVSLHEPLRCHTRSERQWSIDGTPGDCVAIALSHFMAATPPSLILSGVNAGANVGDEINMSGTIGAALTSLMLGVPAIAISQAFTSRDAIRWDTARAILPKTLSHLLARGWRKETVLTINIPDLPAAEVTGLGWARQSQKNIAALEADFRISPRRHEYFWLSVKRQPPIETDNSDSALLKRGKVAVTAMSSDRSLDLGKPDFSFLKHDNNAEKIDEFDITADELSDMEESLPDFHIPEAPETENSDSETTAPPSPALQAMHKRRAHGRRR